MTSRDLNEQNTMFPGVQHDAGGKTRIRIPAGWVVDAAFAGENDCYRLALKHIWNPKLPMALICMMNPSMADLNCLDPTVYKTSRIFKRLGFGGQFIANACAYRATDKMRLLTVSDPVGPCNIDAILGMAARSSLVVIAHGRLPRGLQRHADAMCSALRASGHKLHVLALTQDGTPKHPLYLRETIIPQPWCG